MDWTFREDQPIYTQLITRLSEGIAAGVYAPGERLPVVRELALEAGVNPNTVQRALAELEREGLVYSQRTSGRFVTEDSSRIAELRRRMAEQRIKEFFAAMQQLGCTREEIVSLLKEELQ